jgi:Beta-lactamase enzyme family
MLFSKFKSRKSHVFLNRKAILGFASLIFAAITIYQIIEDIQKRQLESSGCSRPANLELATGTPKFITGQIQDGETSCFSFYASNQLLNLQTNARVRIVAPNGKSFLAQGDFREYLKEDGKYLLRLDESQLNTSYKITISLSGASKQVNQAKTHTQLSDVPTYRTKGKYQLQPNARLQASVENAVALVQNKGLPIDKLSISLIDLNTNSYGEYQELTPRFPASVAKLFWLIALFGYYDAGKEPEGSIPTEDLYKMIQDSDNNVASRVLDRLTDTASGEQLSSEKFSQWILKRQSINHFFSYSGYSSLDISQKNFPISELKLSKPSGRDEQMRGNPSQPTRNSLTSQNIAHLLLEIDQGLAVSPQYSQQAKVMMLRNFAQEKTKRYDSIKSFLGEGLDPNSAQLFSKPGWTSDSRQDAAIIYSQDGKTRYILVVIGDDPKFANDWHIFPKLSQQIYQQMQTKS